MGSGTQWYPWIHIDDEVRAIQFLIEHATATGPYNLCAPEPLPNKGPITAVVDEDCLKDFYDVGKHVWNAQSHTHKLVTVTASRM